MQLDRLGFLVSITALAVATTIGCSQDSGAPSPTAPSASVRDEAQPSATADGATASEIVALDRDDNRGKGGDNEDNKSSGTDRGKPDPGTRGSLSGRVTAVSSSSLTVRGVVVTPAPGATIRHGNKVVPFGDIVVGDQVQAKGTMGTGGLVASEIKVEHTGGRDDEDERRGDGERDDRDDAELSGVISGITATTGCPTLTFKVGTTTVKTSDKTVFDGIPCTALANGAVVEIEGTPQPDGSVLASKVEKDDAGDDDGKGKGSGGKAEGLVSGLPGSGTCPTLTFMVGTKQVVTTAATKFEDVTCATLANGMNVEVSGVVGQNGSITASKVERD